MGEAKRRKQLKKQVSNKYTERINTFVEGLDYYQIYTKFHIQKRGWEIMQLVNEGKLDPGSFKDQRIVENTTYNMQVYEWQWVNHVSSIEKRILFNESLPADNQKPIDNVFENYMKYITGVLDQGCIDDPKKYRKMTSEEFKAKVEDLKIKAQTLKDEKESGKGPENESIIAKNVTDFYSDPEFTGKEHPEFAVPDPVIETEQTVS